MARVFRILGVVMLAALVALGAGWLAWKVFSGGEVNVTKPTTIFFGVLAPILGFVLLIGIGYLLYTRRAAWNRATLWRIVKGGIALFFIVVISLFVYGFYKKIGLPTLIEQKWQEESFSVKAGEELITTTITGPGTMHRICASEKWKLLSGSEKKEYKMPAGCSSIGGLPPEGPLYVKGGEKDAELKIIRLR